MTNHRQEKDLLGTLSVPADALHGIYTERAIVNFPLANRPVHPALITAFGQVKLACLQTNAELGYLPDDIAVALQQACLEMAEGRLNAAILVDALQGGAGTSTNMNVNEVLANRALQIIGKSPGDYETISPLDHVNLHQSTNDTYPTALKVAAIEQLNHLETCVSSLVEEFQIQEKRTAHIVKVGRTQMQDAVPITLGREMAAYAEAFSRDRWRIYKCQERLRVVNLGGTAIGTGTLAPRQYIFKAIEQLRHITGLGLARADNLVEATQNNDAFVEVSGILKACATNLFKVSSDLRFLSSGPHCGIGEINLPARQAGSSIMPGKVNPVIPEAVTQAAMMVMAYDQTIAQAVSMGNLELNPFLPLVADALLNSIDLLANSCTILRKFCVAGLEPNEDRCCNNVNDGTGVVTLLVEELGYQQAQQVAQIAKDRNKTIRQVVLDEKIMSPEAFDNLTSPNRVMRLGLPEKKK
ncbi:MAG: aspartate ammonia-lyase [Phycisphaerae bacterium]|nr:aspartate ammonia-lyase [Phycisphaerae bacterium]